jgi:hypothetical protein
VSDDPNQSNGETAAQRAARLHAQRMANLKPWPKGVSGNPGGRPKGLAAKVREAVREGDLFLEVCLDVIDNAGPRERLEAIKLLWDRGYGRSIETTVSIDGNGNEAAELASALSREQLEDVARALKPDAPAETPSTDPIN